jgi:hypothetical protein
MRLPDIPPRSAGQHDLHISDVATTSGKAGVNSTSTVKLIGKDFTNLSPDGGITWVPGPLVTAITEAQS